MTEEGKGTEVTDEKQQAPTPEEQLESLHAQLAAERDKTQKLEDSYKGIQRTLNTKDAELKRQSSVAAEIEDLKELVKLQIAYNETMSGDPSITEPSGRQDLLKKFDEMESKRKDRLDKEVKDRQQAEWQEVVGEFQARMQKLNIKETDDVGFQIYDLVTSNDPIRIARARTILDKLEAEKVADNPDKKGEDTVEQEIQKRLLAEMKKRNMLDDTDTIPSAAKSDVQKARDAYIRGEIDSAEAQRRGVVFS